MSLTHRPPVGLRVVIALVGCGAVIANATLLLSDRAPLILRTLFGDSVRRITERLDADGRAESALGARDIGNDSIVHFGLWAVAALIVGLAVWSWLGLATSSIAVAAISLFLEVAQGRYSSSRAVEASDAAFNLLGVTAGAVGAALAYVVMEATGRLFTTRQ